MLELDRGRCSTCYMWSCLGNLYWDAQGGEDDHIARQAEDTGNPADVSQITFTSLDTSPAIEHGVLQTIPTIALAALKDKSESDALSTEFAVPQILHFVLSVIDRAQVLAELSLDPEPQCSSHMHAASTSVPFRMPTKVVCRPRLLCQSTKRDHSTNNTLTRTSQAGTHICKTARAGEGVTHRCNDSSQVATKVRH